MVSKLSFKGDNPKIKKKKIKTVGKKVKKEVENLPIWVKAEHLSQLKGPLTIQLNEDKSLISHESSILRFSKDLTFRRFQEEDVIEPNSITQVFIGVTIPIETKNKNELKLAFKTSDDKYIGFYKDADQNNLRCTSDTISDSQIFTVSKIEDGTGFFISKEGNYLGKDLNFVNEPISFIIRIQRKNLQIVDKDSIKTSNYANIESAITELNKYNVSVTIELKQRLREALKQGKLNEQIIIEKTSSKSDSRC
ncbi:hypothetical protein WICMUC_001191 [Wickerhamomyces mucosus]|uniref:Uncharacterized protein n=1 Tax=Wickerhamomyces mucosus TaxID=1378264 RepID=A0A9P8PX28_9ASCO|nr:hypothetical protein WICMUC_001191 [Wickerhamomyces mucosus]